MMKELITVSFRGQIVIPKKMREKAGLTSRGSTIC